MIVLSDLTIVSEDCIYTLRRKLLIFFKKVGFNEISSIRYIGFLSELIRLESSEGRVLISIDQQKPGVVVIFKIKTPKNYCLRPENFFSSVKTLDGYAQLTTKLLNRDAFTEKELADIVSDLNQKSVEELLSELEEKNRALANNSLQLEDKVKQRTKEAERARIEAEKANVAKSQFLSNMSHELRTPLNGVLGYAQVLQNTPELKVKYESSLRGITNCGEHLLTVINDILDISKIEAGKLDIVFDEVDIQKTVFDTVDILRYKALEKNLKLKSEFDQDVPAYLKSDPTKLRQILVNLVGNSVKYTDLGEIKVKVEKVEKMVKFSVIDTGIGIPKVKQTSVFEAFRQDEGGRKVGGTGLGLAICVKLVEALGGEIGLESTQHKGSTFWFTHPADLSCRETVVAQVDNPSIENIAISSSNLDNRSLKKEWLNKLSRAIELGDFVELNNLAIQLEEESSNPEVANFLREKSAAFEFEAIAKALLGEGVNDE